jgi:myo-inositol-1(or 4)-monophosphatase
MKPSSTHTTIAINKGEFVTPMMQIAREAGGLLMDFFARRVTIEYKGDADLVTVADRTSEKLIRERIKQLWPSHDILGEEEGLVDTGSEYRWYVDPLDGTTNFAHGFPVFCVSMGLEHKGRRVAGVIFDPTRDEMFSAEQGSGAHLNGQPIHVSKTAKLVECLVATGFPSHKRHKNPNIHFYHQITLRTHGVRRAGSAALDLCYVACGRFDGFWEFNLNPWDTAAGVLIVEEAGGRVTNFAGGTFELNSRETLASNGLVHQEMIHEFEQIFAGRGLEPIPDPRRSG